MNFGVIMYQTSTSKGQELVAQRMTKELALQGGKAVLITSRFHDFRPVISADEVRRNGGYVRFEDSSLGIEIYRVESARVDWPPRRIEFNNFISILDRIVGELHLDVLITHSTLWNGPDLAAQFVSWKRKVFAERGEGQLLLFHMSHFQPAARQRYSLQEREWRRSWNNYVLRRVIREADRLLVTTPNAERHMVELGASREQCMLFPGGIEVPRHVSNRELAEFKVRHGIQPEARLVTFLGTVEERKNVDAILRVAKLLQGRQDIRFLIAGRTESPYARKIKSHARSAPNVTLLGEIGDDEKAELIRASDLNLSMSKMEALGLAQLEFMSAGIPVVTSGVGGQSWVVKNGHTGIVLRGPHDIKGAANAIAMLIDDAARKSRLGRNARSFASKLTMEALTKKLILEVRMKSGTCESKAASQKNGNMAHLALTRD